MAPLWLATELLLLISAQFGSRAFDPVTSNNPLYWLVEPPVHLFQGLYH